MGKDLAVRTLREITISLNPDVIFLSEIHQQRDYIEDLRTNMGYHHSFYVDPIYTAGDVGFKGQAYTWARKENGVIMLHGRLNRSLVNEDWLVLWPNSSLTHLTRIGSDHNPLLFSTKPTIRKGKPTFRFESTWAEEMDAELIVKDCWTDNPALSNMENLVSNLKKCKSYFSSLRKKKYPKCNRELIKECLLELDAIQTCNHIISSDRQLELESSINTLWIREENGEDGIRCEFESQFQNIFTTACSRSWGHALTGISSFVTPRMNSDLLASISLDEISAATHQLGALKAPGPDGFLGLFYHKYWNIVQKVVWQTSHDFINGNACLKELNRTHIVLIPKVPSPKMTGHFRPISLCNNSYKIVSKVLANRLKLILPSLIYENRNAFVPGRLIQDNILLAHEAYYYLKLKREGRNHEFGLKLDMNKAYDKIERDFLEATLFHFGFDVRWIMLVMSCVRTVSFSIVLNGKPRSFFKSTRGLRQGDPLSPYIFLLGTLKNCKSLAQILNEYCTTSGQMINREKSSIYFSPNTPRQMAFLMGELLSFKKVYNPGIYLGMPSLWGRSKRVALSFIKERIHEKIDGWKQTNLTLAGKEILIKSVAFFVPSFPMSCFKLPVGTFSEMGQFNLALIAKQCWRIIQEPDSMWVRVLKGRYFALFWRLRRATELHGAGPAFWKQGMCVMKEGFSQVNIGKSINIWKDPWLPPPNISMISTTVPILDHSPTSVSSLIDWNTRSWDLRKIEHFVHPLDLARISSMPIGVQGGDGRFLWSKNKNGHFSVASAYHWLHELNSSYSLTRTSTSHVIDSKIWKAVWKINTLPKICMFMWRIFVGTAPSMQHLHSRMILSSHVCPLCVTADESLEHILLLCPWVDGVWFASLLGFIIDKQRVTTFDRWLFAIIQSSNMKDIPYLLTMISSLCWMIWKDRCLFVYQKKTPDPIFTMRSVISLISEFTAASLYSGKRLSIPPIWTPPCPGSFKINVNASSVLLSVIQLVLLLRRLALRC
ncbi:uncharacterized protein LOC126803595 [Argentina anserina]|uniref:uncharacterized protein LOC126803595 n=1 Tax=Argentina anserina TaxID=57926 RepID=UPI00217664C3|nr:uncharacterized protein LOC126803595 [Potentilla anserina]